eukprot:15554425-Heterocapsa_arctica.AAC.1
MDITGGLGVASPPSSGPSKRRTSWPRQAGWHGCPCPDPACPDAAAKKVYERAGERGGARAAGGHGAAAV